MHRNAFCNVSVTLRLQLSLKHVFACRQESRIVYCESVVCMAQTMQELKHVLPGISRLPDVPGHDGALEMSRAPVKEALSLSFCLLAALAFIFTFLFCVTMVASMCGGVRTLVFLLELAMVSHFFASRRLQGRAAQQSAVRWILPTLALLLHPACVGLLLLPFHPVLFLCLFAMLVMCACVCQKFSAWQVSKGPRQVFVRCEQKTRRREAIRRRRQASRQLRALCYEKKIRSMRARCH